MTVTLRIGLCGCAALLGGGAWVFAPRVCPDMPRRPASSRAVPIETAGRGRFARRPGAVSADPAGPWIGTLDEAEVASILCEPAVYFPDGMPARWRRALLARWARLNPAAAASYAVTSNDGDLSFVLGAWAGRDPASVCTWLRTCGDPQVAEAVRRDPNSRSLPPLVALTVLETLSPDGDVRWGVDLLSRASPADVALWLRDARSTPLRQRTLIAFAQLHPEEAREKILAAVGSLSPDAAREQLLNVIIGQWARIDPAAATAWLERQPDPAGCASVWASLTAQWAEAYPIEAVRIAVQLPAGRAQEQAVISAVSGWVRQDPASAAAWVSRFPEGNLRCEAVRQIVSCWAGNDPTAAGNWISILPVGPSRDAALATFRAIARGTVAN